MKKLSEIGREMWANEGVNKNPFLFLDAQRLGDSPDQQRVVCLTADELRKLVREAIERWVLLGNICKLHLGDQSAAKLNLEYFLNNEGL